MQARSGEEFRDDVRKKLPTEVLTSLTTLSPRQSSWAILQNLALIVLVITIAITNWSWWSALLAIIFIAPLQHWLFILAHESAHYRLYENRSLNDAIGRLVGVMGGDFGYSFACNCSASQLVIERLAATTWLAMAALCLTLVSALPLGWLAARYHDGWFDRAVLVISVALLSTPAFLLALLALVVAARTGWFPLGGMQSINATQTTKLDFLHHLILPAAVLALRLAPSFLRQWRTSLLETNSMVS